MDAAAFIFENPLVRYAGGALLLFKLGSLLFSIISSLYAMFLRPSINFKKLGEWAGDDTNSGGFLTSLSCDRRYRRYWPGVRI
jgi:hypothetical protein